MMLYRLQFDMAEVLAMIVGAGGDLDRVLETVDSAPDPAAALHMAALRAKLRPFAEVPNFEDFDLEEQQDAARQLGAWLERDTVIIRVLNATELLDDPNYDDVLSFGM